MGPTGPVLCLDPLRCLPGVKALEIRGKNGGNDGDKGILSDNKGHICQHVSRLIGHYKIIYFLQCVRMFWTLRPGLMKPADAVITKDEKEFVYKFHNLTVDDVKFFEWDVYPNGVNGNTKGSAIGAGVSVYSVE
jgi:hypothetical protein